MMLTVALLAVLAAHPPSKVARPKSIELVGKVKEVSGGPGTTRALLILEGGGQYQLHGTGNPSTSELRRLSGAKVRVYGVTGAARTPRGKHVLVDRYEIVDVGKGVVPRVGQLGKLELNGTSRLIFVDEQGNADLLPTGWATKMTKHVGAKLWIVGEGSGEAFKPRKFAILASRKQK